MPKSSGSPRPSLMAQLSVNKNRAAWVGVGLTALAMLTGAILYVTTARAEVKAWAAEEDQATQSIIRAEMKETYVNQVQYTKDITILDERQQMIKKDVSDIKTMLKDMHDEMREESNSRRGRYTPNDRSDE